MLVGLFPQSEKAVEWLKQNLQALESTFVGIHRQNHPPVTVGSQPPEPSFYAVFACADDPEHAQKTVQDVLQALERLRVKPRDFKVMIRAE